MYLIISLKVAPQDFSDQTEDLENIMVDYADLLRLTLKFWKYMGQMHDVAETDVLRSAIETYLNETCARRLLNFQHQQDMVDVVMRLMKVFHESLHSQLAPLLEDLSEDTKIIFNRFLHTDAVIELEIPDHETKRRV